jgi:hypothetical protein
MTEQSRDPPDTRLLDQRIHRAIERHMERGSTGSGSGGGGDWERRLTNVESTMARIDSTVTRLDARFDQLPKATDIAELKGRVSQLPTMWQLSGLIIAIFGLAFALVRFALPR